MANSNAPYGLRPVRHLSGGTLRYNAYPIADDYATDIYYGDPVKLSSSGVLQVAAAGDVLLGVFMGCFYTPDTGNNQAPVWANKWPASTSSQNAMGLVCDDPNVIFSVQASGNTAATAIGENADITYTAGNSIGISKVQWDTATQATTTANLRCVGRVDDPTNAWGTNVKLLVLINEHYYKQTAGV